MSRQVAAIIPAFNEEETIADVVGIAVTSSLVDEVVVVSDGSTDATVKKAKKAGARVLDLPVQAGKGPAMAHGLASTDAPIVLFLDADLRGFHEGHIEQLLAPVLNGSRKMNIGLRDRGWLSRVVGPWLPLVSGERALVREIFETVPDQHLKGYMVEASLNFATRSRKWPYGPVFLAGLKIRTKIEKVGWWKAVPQYAKMWGQVLKAYWVVRAAYARGLVDLGKLKEVKGKIEDRISTITTRS